jgi:hypothetical protein
MAAIQTRRRGPTASPAGSGANNGANGRQYAQAVPLASHAGIVHNRGQEPP